MSFLFKNIISIYNIFFINIKIFFIKIILKKKIIFFYHPKKKLTKNNLTFITDYFAKKKKYYFLYGSTLIFYKSNFFLIKQSYLKFLYGVDLFLSNNVCDKFTPKSVKVYLHHDIYDTPLVEKSKEKKLLSKLNNYNFIVVATQHGKKVFENLFNKNPNVKIVVFKYLKIDYILKKIKQSKIKQTKTILIAPTNYLSFPKMSMQSKLNVIFQILLKNNYRVIYRPHPSNFDDLKVIKLKSKYENYKNFIFDNSPDYFESYKISNFLLTDISGTAYTYAVTTTKPALFFNINEVYNKLLKYNELNYFKNINKIGWKVNSTNKIIEILNNKQKVSNKKNKIFKFRKIFLQTKDLDLKYFLNND